MRHITTRQNRSTGSQVTLYAEDGYSYNSYHVHCDTHGVDSPRQYSRDDIWPSLTHPDRFCEGCRAARANRPNRSTRRSSRGVLSWTTAWDA